VRPPALRWVLLWPLLLTVSIGFTALALYVEHNARDGQIAAIDAELVRVEQRTVGHQPGGANTIDGSDVDAPIRFVIRADGSAPDLISGSIPFSADQIAGLSGFVGRTTLEAGTRYRVRASPMNDGSTLVSSLSLDAFDASMARLRRSLVVGGGVIFLFVSVIVMIIATTVTRPVARMSRTANRIADGAFDTTIDQRAGSREIADLAADLGRMLGRLNASLAESRRLTEEANRARDDMQRFLADASHELRTPLTSLKGYSDLYARDMLGEPGHLDRAMDRIGSESVRLSELVNDMLQLANNGDPSQLQLERVDVADVVGDVVDDLEAGFGHHTIDVRIVSDASHAVLGDRARLHQAILNLGTNACVHGGADSAVSISVHSGGGQVVIAVADRGPGVDPDVADRIFLPFFRGDASRTRDGHGGAGLGLAITKRIAEQHGGDVTIERTEGGGATFCMTILAASSRTELVASER
jgi:two-component system, OmpR family, sensor kinase